MKKLFYMAGLVLISSMAAHAQSAQGHPGQEAYESEKELNKLYHYIQETCLHAAEVGQALADNQTLWLQYRETQLDLRFYGVYDPLEKAKFMAKLNRQRMEELDAMLADMERNGQCPSGTALR